MMASAEAEEELECCWLPAWEEGAAVREWLPAEEGLAGHSEAAVEERSKLVPLEGEVEGGPREPVRRHRCLEEEEEEGRARGLEAQGRVGRRMEEEH